MADGSGLNNILSKTCSICPVCHKKIEAVHTIGEDGFVYMEKDCGEHGHFKTIIWEGAPESYLDWGEENHIPDRPIGACVSKKGCPDDCGLCENHESNGCCVLLELTDRCNLRCPVCFARAGEECGQEATGNAKSPRISEYSGASGTSGVSEYSEALEFSRVSKSSGVSEISGASESSGVSESSEVSESSGVLEASKTSEVTEPSLAEISLWYDMLMEKGGPFNIQLSGGEPTLREDLPEIIALGRQKGFTFFQLNTNGIRIAKEEGYGKVLKNAGVSCVYLQFDGMSEKPYIALRGKALLDTKLKAIDNCGKAGISVVLVPTVAAGINDGELGRILDFAISRMPLIRGVHFQPASQFGRYELGQDTGYRITIPKVLRLIEEQTEGRIKGADFAGGGAESPYCSFHASYRKDKNGILSPMKRRRSGCCSSSVAMDYVANQWGTNPFENVAKDGNGGGNGGCGFDDFLKELHDSKFAVSGMVFMDEGNLDLNRLKRCYICEVDHRNKMIPFCAYNNLYRGI